MAPNQGNSCLFHSLDPRTRLCAQACLDRGQISIFTVLLHETTKMEVLIIWHRRTCSVYVYVCDQVTDGEAFLCCHLTQLLRKACEHVLVKLQPLQVLQVAAEPTLLAEGVDVSQLIC